MQRRSIAICSLTPKSDPQALARYITNFSRNYSLLVMNGRSWTCQVVYLVNFQQDLLHDIMSDSLKVGLVQQMLDILFATSKEVVQAYDLHKHPCKPTCVYAVTVNAIGAHERTSHSSSHLHDPLVQPETCRGGYRQTPLHLSQAPCFVRFAAWS